MTFHRILAGDPQNCRAATCAQHCVEEAPSSRTAIHDYLPFVERDTFYTCASGDLGYGLPAAVGVALDAALIEAFNAAAPMLVEVCVI